MTNLGEALDDLGDTHRVEYIANVPCVDGGTFARCARALLAAHDEHLNAPDFNPDTAEHLRLRAVEFDKLAVRHGRMPATPDGRRYARRRFRMSRKKRRGW